MYFTSDTYICFLTAVYTLSFMQTPSKMQVINNKPGVIQQNNAVVAPATPTKQNTLVGIQSLGQNTVSIKVVKATRQNAISIKVVEAIGTYTSEILN